MSARLTAAELDARIADKEEPFYSDLSVAFPTRPLVGANRREIGSYVHSSSTDIRKTFAAVRAGELKPADPSLRVRAAEAAAAEDKHVRAMVDTHAGSVKERWLLVADGLLYVLFLACLFCLCVAGWNKFLPGGGT